jgi:hypothetical protein
MPQKLEARVSPSFFFEVLEKRPRLPLIKDLKPFRDPRALSLLLALAQR